MTRDELKDIVVYAYASYNVTNLADQTIEMSIDYLEQGMPRNMTLQQLFRTANFDQAFTYITKFHPKSANSRFPYQVAFEWLCELEPVTTDEERSVYPGWK